MRVLLVYSNRTRDLILAPPIGLSYVASATRRAGHTVRFLDLLTAPDPDAALGTALREFAPDVVGISVRNIDNVVHQRLQTHLGELGQFIATIRRATRGRMPIVLGGPAISILGSAALAHVDADYAVRGEGEITFPALLAALEAGRDPGSIPGVCTRETGGAQDGLPTRLPTFGGSGMQDWIDWKAYARQGGTFAIQTKRGCPMSCSYCSYPDIEGQKLRRRDPVDVGENLRERSLDEPVPLVHRAERASIPRAVPGHPEEEPPASTCRATPPRAGCCACSKGRTCRSGRSTEHAWSSTFTGKGSRIGTSRCQPRCSISPAPTGARIVRRPGCFPRPRATASPIASLSTPGRSPAAVSRVPSGALLKSGVPKRAHVHTLRHSYATALVEAGVNLRLIHDALGHRSARTTQICTHLTQDVRATLQDPLTHLVDGLC